MKKQRLAKIGLTAVLVGFTCGAVQAADGVGKNAPNMKAQCPCAKNDERQVKLMIPPPPLRAEVQKSVKKERMTRPRSKMIGRM